MLHGKLISEKSLRNIITKLRTSFTRNRSISDVLLFEIDHNKEQYPLPVYRYLHHLLSSPWSLHSLRRSFYDNDSFDAYLTYLITLPIQNWHEKRAGYWNSDTQQIIISMKIDAREDPQRLALEKGIVSDHGAVPSQWLGFSLMRRGFSLEIEHNERNVFISEMLFQGFQSVISDSFSKVFSPILFNSIGLNLTVLPSIPFK